MTRQVPTLGQLLSRPLKDFLLALAGPRYAWGRRRQCQLLSADYSARLQDAFAWTTADVRLSTQQPVFVLSAGWRSGSTLLQRMLMQYNKDLLIWGEPYAHSSICERMADQFRAFIAHAPNKYPHHPWFLSRTDGTNLPDRWVANLFPDVDCLVKAHRAFFDSLFGAPAREFGCCSWGMKEVRLTIDHATYFRTLYPKCKILLLCRDPRDAYFSYRSLRAAWFRRWPDEPVTTPIAFGRQWTEMTRGFIAGRARVDAMLVRYEDLDDRATAERLEQYLGWRVPRASLLEHRDFITPRDTRKTLPWIDRAILDRATGQVRKEMGYN